MNQCLSTGYKLNQDDLLKGVVICSGEFDPLICLTDLINNFENIPTPGAEFGLRITNHSKI